MQRDDHRHRRSPRRPAVRRARGRGRGLGERAEIDAAPEHDEEQRDEEAFAQPDQLIGDATGLAERRHHHAGREARDQHARVEALGDPGEREQHEQRDAAGRAPSRDGATRARKCPDRLPPRRPRRPTNPTAAARRNDEHGADRRPCRHSARQHERNGDDGRDVGDRHPRHRDEQCFAADSQPSSMIGQHDRRRARRDQHCDHGSVVQARCARRSAAPPRCCERGGERGRDQPLAQCGSAVACSRIGSCVPTMNINSAKPIAARNTSVGWSGTIVRVPVRPTTTPAGSRR